MSSAAFSPRLRPTSRSPSERCRRFAATAAHRHTGCCDCQRALARTARSYGQFYRDLLLPEAVSGDECEATFDNGVLEVKFPLPKQQERKARRIDVK